jgi:hypothetical protein
MELLEYPRKCYGTHEYNFNNLICKKCKHYKDCSIEKKRREDAE